MYAYKERLVPARKTQDRVSETNSAAYLGFREVTLKDLLAFENGVLEPSASGVVPFPTPWPLLPFLSNFCAISTTVVRIP